MSEPLHLLLVEDSSLDVELTLARLDSAGFTYDAHIVDNAVDFDAAMRTGRYDVVLADFVLPTFSGGEALEMARAHSPSIPFVFVSGVLGEEHAVDMLKRGATDYVLKQRLQRLPAVIERALAERDEKRQRLQAEERLQETETHFRQVVDALKDYAVITLDPRGDIQTWNHAARQILGYTEAQMVGGGAAVLFGQDDVLTEALRTAKVLGSHSDDRWMSREDGQRVFVSLVTTAMHDARGALLGFSLIVRDTTQARLTADALQQAKEEAERANRAKDHFLAVLSHELRTPLTPILAAARLMRMKGELDEERTHLLNVVQHNVELEARLIDDLLDLTSIARGKLSLNFTSVTLGDLLANAVNMSAADISAKGQTLQITRQETQSGVRGDAARLQQIVWNIVKNAVKFTPAGGSINVTMFNPDCEHVSVRVDDSGIGISAEALPKIFSAFEQADETIGPAFGGLGLGLAIAKTLAMKHGGSIVAESAGRDRGARFTFTIPLVRDTPVAVDTTVAPESVNTAGHVLSVLLVEDNAHTAAAMAQLIEVFGHRVDVAESVGAARQCIDSARYDLLISDIGLPDGTGLDVVRHWNVVQQDAPSIAITGYGMEEDMRRCREAGFGNHVTKPVDFDRLESMLDHIAQARG
ncbi:response regulator [Robbsia sp. KACC 23696]|uniref:hybrid sensor histidine kinase/response regulator n=1 Tax=Robbsia sp. KACC 23696 TaxID=3149231 RepID=UPI00325C1E65